MNSISTFTINTATTLLSPQALTLLSVFIVQSFCLPSGTSINPRPFQTTTVHSSILPITPDEDNAESTLSKNKEDGAEHSTSTYIGVVTALLGNICISCALNIQKYVHNKLIGRSENEEERLLLDSDSQDQEGSETSSWHGYGNEYGNRNGAVKYAPDKLVENTFRNSVSGVPEALQSLEIQGNKRNEYLPSNQSRGLLDNQRSPSPSSLESYEDGRLSGDEESNEEEEVPKQEENTNYMKEPKWWFGFILMICGEFGNFLAYGFAPASVVAPLGTIALVANAIIAPCALGETFRKRDLFGIILAIFGTVTIVLSAKQKETQFDPDALVEALLQPQFLIYFLFTVAAIIAMMSLSDTIGKRIILVDISLVALFGGYTVLATKGISSLLGLTFVKMFTYGITYLMVFVMISTGVMQIRYLNRALSRFDSTAVIPTQFVLFTICAIVGSALLYNDFDDVSPTLMITFIAGCCLTFLGVFLITSNREKSKHPIGSYAPSSIPASTSGSPRKPRSIDSSRPGSQSFDYDGILYDYPHTGENFGVNINTPLLQQSPSQSRFPFSHHHHRHSISRTNPPSPIFAAPYLSSSFSRSPSQSTSQTASPSKQSHKYTNRLQTYPMPTAQSHSIISKISSASMEGISQILSGVGVRHSHSLQLSQVMENYGASPAGLSRDFNRNTDRDGERRTGKEKGRGKSCSPPRRPDFGGQEEEQYYSTSHPNYTSFRHQEEVYLGRHRKEDRFRDRRKKSAEWGSLKYQSPAQKGERQSIVSLSTDTSYPNSPPRSGSSLNQSRHDSAESVGGRGSGRVSSFPSMYGHGKRHHSYPDGVTPTKRSHGIRGHGGEGESDRSKSDGVVGSALRGEIMEGDQSMSPSKYNEANQEHEETFNISMTLTTDPTDILDHVHDPEVRNVLSSTEVWCEDDRDSEGSSGDEDAT